MTNQLPFELEYGSGLKHLGLSEPLSAKAKAQAIAYARASHAMYIIAGGRRGQFSFEGLIEMQERLMREQFDPQLDKYFPGGEYNGKTDLLHPSRQGFLPKRA